METDLSAQALADAMATLSVLTYFPKEDQERRAIMRNLAKRFNGPKYHRGQKMSSDEQLELVAEAIVSDNDPWMGMDQIGRKSEELFPNIQPWGKDGPLR